jgi:O-antigen/teichoic acid export membrane protein
MKSASTLREVCSMSPEGLVLALLWSDSVHSLLALAIGFAVAGLLSSGYQLMTLQPASFRLLHEGERNKALAAVPFLIFAAPFIIIRNTIRGRRVEGRNFGFAAMASFLAGFWSLMSGTVVVMTLEAIGHIVA